MSDIVKIEKSKGLSDEAWEQIKPAALAAVVELDAMYKAGEVSGDDVLKLIKKHWLPATYKYLVRALVAYAREVRGL